jgi:hypothetical protein
MNDDQEQDSLRVRDEDYDLWDEAKRLLAFYQRIALTAFITEKLREYEKEENARQAAGTSTKGCATDGN